MPHWSYQVTPEKGVVILADNAPYSSFSPKDGNCNMNAINSITFLYDLGNGLIQDSNIDIYERWQIAHIISSAVRDLIPP
jgi:hypothetical protein